MRVTPIASLLAAVLLLSACGETRLERAGSGAVIGGTIGFGVGAVCCMNPPAGIGLGTAIGAGVGAGTALITALLMIWKTGMHAHPFPDYPTGLILDILRRAPMWALAGILVGVALALLKPKRKDKI